MKKSTLSEIPGFALVLGFAFATMFASCGGGGDDWPGIGGGGQSITVPGNTLAAKLEWVKNNAQSGKNYIVEVSADEIIAPYMLVYRTGSSFLRDITIILRGIGGERTISIDLNSYITDGYVFAVFNGHTLILDNNITLRGKINIGYSGILIMNDGSLITGDTTFNTGGVGMTGGSFTMNGGKISGISNRGVGMTGGTFTMNGGEISDNTGGVRMEGGTFTMNGGKISGNTTSGYGGGVYYEGGTFTMNGGEISGNTAERGGGISVISFVADRSDLESIIMNMNGGEISGNTAALGGGVFVIGRWSYQSTMPNPHGPGVSSQTVDCKPAILRIVTGTIYGSDAAAQLRNTSALGGGGIVEYGTFSGTTWNSAGSLNTTDNTIRVVNGALR